MSKKLSPSEAWDLPRPARAKKVPRSSCGISLLDPVRGKFGMLTPIGTPFMMSRGSGKSRQSYVVCECECGNTCVPRLHRMLRGESQSCGCMFMVNAVASHVTHGMSRTKEHARVYGIWVGMRSRCRNPKLRAYKYYGAKGVQVCPQWDCDGGFEQFIKDMGHPPSESHSMDRIDSDGDYCPENCRWATVVEQARNKSKFPRYEYAGEMLTLSELADRSALSKYTIADRLKRGWDVKQAVEVKAGGKRNGC